MKIKNVIPLRNFQLMVEFDDGTKGAVDIAPYLQYEAFESLKDIEEFVKIKNGGYYVEWECGADLSIDTLSAKLKKA